MREPWLYSYHVKAERVEGTRRPVVVQLCEAALNCCHYSFDKQRDPQSAERDDPLKSYIYKAFLICGLLRHCLLASLPPTHSLL